MQTPTLMVHPSSNDQVSLGEGHTIFKAADKGLQLFVYDFHAYWHLQSTKRTNQPLPQGPGHIYPVADDVNRPYSYSGDTLCTQLSWLYVGSFLCLFGLLSVQVRFLRRKYSVYQVFLSKDAQN
jgi:hypothetical protein